MNNRCLIAIFVLLVLITVFIWGNSVLPTEKSGKLSAGFEEWLAGLFGLEELPFDVRKAAHFCEYAAFGFLISVFAVLRKRLTPVYLFCYISTGLFVSVVDESIQILSLRGPMVADVLLDFAGFLLGFGIFFLLHRIFRPKRAQ
ncbi:MAG: VanZ family protein [Clostridiales bacterium]|nr:VanZ family protein [Clostridiales bacterium]